VGVRGKLEIQFFGKGREKRKERGREIFWWKVVVFFFGGDFSYEMSQ